MTTTAQHVAETSAALRERLRRHKLLFVQSGALFGGFDELVIRETGATVVDARSLAEVKEATRIVVTGLEDYAAVTGPSPSLGELRQTVSSLLDGGTEICLWSKSPRISYAPVPGSSLFEDASPFFMHLMSDDDGPESIYPAMHFESSTKLSDVYARALADLGVAVMASLDRAVFDGQMDHASMFELLDPREIEALRGAGFAHCPEGRRYEFTAPSRFGEFKTELANVLAAEVRPQSELAQIAGELWTMERILRHALRDAALARFDQKWRGQVLHGDLNEKVIGRAMEDGAVGVKSVRELRDPIEWLTLGELIEVITSKTFGGLELSPIFWGKFRQEVLPVRNRLSHMRHFKHGDRSIVRVWLAQVERTIGNS